MKKRLALRIVYLLNVWKSRINRFAVIYNQNYIYFGNNRTDTISNPRVIIEVLSPSTKRYDRSNKFEEYRTIPTFEEYLLLDQTRIYIEHFSKTDNKRWSFCDYDESDEAITLSSVSFEISLADVYNKVNFELVDAETAPEVGEV